jgi:hyperosmotically inducible periplasmic protein
MAASEACRHSASEAGGPFGQWRKPVKLKLSILTPLLFASLFSGCASEHKSPDVSSDVRKSLDQSGLQAVHVSQDRDKGVVTLSGNVPSQDDKMRAEDVAKSIAGGQVVADEIAVTPPGVDDAKTVDSDFDKAIKNNLDAALRQNHLNKDVSYDVKNGVVTLTGTVNSQGRRAEAQKIAASIPSVQQVVNELDVKNQKATSTTEGH